MLQKDSLLSLSNDEDPTEDKTLSQNVSHEATLKGPQAVHPHPNTQERQETHLPLTRPIKTLLFIQEDLPLEVRSEVLDLGADVLLHHGVQRDPELIQLGLQRGQLRSLLSAQKSSRPPHCQDDSSRPLPQTLSFHQPHFSFQGFELSVLQVFESGFQWRSQKHVGEEVRNSSEEADDCSHTVGYYPHNHVSSLAG